MNTTDLCMASLTDVADLIRTRALSPVELTRAVLERITKYAALNSYVTVTADAALSQAGIAEREIGGGLYRGPLHGVPIGIKDLCATAGVRTTCASNLLADWVPSSDATVVANLRAAGAIVVGKLNMTEFALSGYAPGRPIPVNPWNANHFTGVSSSGSGVASAAGLCFAAVGTDTGGSIRFPAACCGVVGLKPTYGRVSRHGVFPLADSLDHIGPLARRVADCAAMLDAMAGYDPKDPTSLQSDPPNCLAGLDDGIVGVRIGIDPGYSTVNLPPDIVASLRAFAGVLESRGARIVETKFPAVDADLLDGWSVLCAGDAAVAHAATFPARADAYGVTFRTFLEYASTLGARDYARAHIARMKFSGQLRAVFRTVDVMLCPSMPIPPPRVAFMNPYARFSPALGSFMRFTAPFDFSGSPTLSVPCGFTPDGLPYSAQLVAAHLDEALLCRLGHAYQQATDWHTRRPPAVA